MLLGPGLLARVDLSPAQRVRVVVGHLVTPAARLPIPPTAELYTTNPPYLEAIRADRLRLMMDVRGGARPGRDAARCSLSSAALSGGVR
jgi:hypothetical protein